MGATFSRVINNKKTNSEQTQTNETNGKMLKDDNITQFVFVIEEDILIEEEPIIPAIIVEPETIVEPIIEPVIPIIEVLIEEVLLKEEVSMDIMKEVLAEEVLDIVSDVEEVLPIVSDRKLRKRRKKSL